MCQSRFGKWRATGIAICRGGEGRKPRWNELEGKLLGRGRVRFIARGKNVLSVTFFRSVLRGVKGIRSLSRRANSRLAELSGTARESEAGRRDGRP